MARNDPERIKRNLELQRLRTFARIETMKDGGPIIDLITGREPHPVGTKVCIKAGMRALPWESIKAEKPMIELCEVASPIRSVLSQPHELFMKVTGESREWMYRPDLLVTAERNFVEEVLAGQSFSEAVAAWKSSNGAEDLVTLVIEVKDDLDPRIDDPIYATKLEFAARSMRASTGGSPQWCDPRTSRTPALPTRCAK